MNNQPPPLLTALQDAVVDLMLRHTADAQREAEIATLLAQHPEHAEALRRELDSLKPGVVPTTIGTFYILGVLGPG